MFLYGFGASATIMLCSTGRPLFPQYERIVGRGTMGGKSRERQVWCLKLHVMYCGL
jgi:hypothetical protein